MTLRTAAMEWLKSAPFDSFIFSDKVCKQIQIQIAY